MPEDMTDHFINEREVRRQQISSLKPICSNPNCTNYDSTHGDTHLQWCGECKFHLSSAPKPIRSTGTLEQEPEKPLSKTERLFQTHEGLCAMALSVMRSKNHDYCAGKPEADPFANFRVSEVLSGTPMCQGILIRMVDKFQRLRCFVETNSLQVKEESVSDVFVDIINYCVLMKGILDEQSSP